MYDSGLPLPVPPALPDNAALFLDFDGTLVELSEDTERVDIPTGLPDLLTDLSSLLQGAVAIVSGRSLVDLDRLLAPAVLPGAGLHGAELRRIASGSVASIGAPELTRLAASLRETLIGCNGVSIDQQGAASVKVLFGRTPQHAEDCRAAMYRLATARILEIFEHEGCIEARPRGNGKGYALRILIEEAAFRGRAPVFVGNGVTDEDGFKAAAALGGFGVKIGSGTTLAGYRLQSVQELHHWLSCSLGAVEPA